MLHKQLKIRQYVTIGSIYTVNNGDTNKKVNVEMLSVFADSYAGGVPDYPISGTNSGNADAGFQFQWQLNTGAGFNNISDTGIYSGTNTKTLNFTILTLAEDGYQYRLEVTHDFQACFSHQKEFTLSVIDPCDANANGFVDTDGDGISNVM